MREITGDRASESFLLCHKSPEDMQDSISAARLTSAAWKLKPSMSGIYKRDRRDRAVDGKQTNNQS